MIEKANKTQDSVILSYQESIEKEFQKKLSRRKFIGGGLIAVLGISEILNWQDQLGKKSLSQAKAESVDYSQVLGATSTRAPSELAVRNYVDNKFAQLNAPANPSTFTPAPIPIRQPESITNITNYVQSRDIPITFGNSSSISLIGSGNLNHSITASIKLSQNPENQIQISNDGLFVGKAVGNNPDPLSTRNTPSIVLTQEGVSVLSGEVRISPALNNAITTTATGLFVPSTSSIPRAKLLLSIPRGNQSLSPGLANTAEYQPTSNNTFPVKALDSMDMNQTLELRVSLFPSDPAIFNKSCKLFLFRYNPRNNKSKGNFRGGSGWVHPTHSPFGATPNKTRFWGGSHVTSPTSFFNRVTEVDAVFNDWYGGTLNNPNGVSFLFRPAAWFNVDMDADPCFFPQPYNNASFSGIKPNAYLNDGYIESTSGAQLRWRYPIFRQNNVSLNRRSHLHPFGLGLMIPNPSYTGSNQEPDYILCSEIEQFVVSFRKTDALDTDGRIKQFAIDWKLDFARGGRK